MRLKVGNQGLHRFSRINDILHKNNITVFHLFHITSLNRHYISKVGTRQDIVVKSNVDRFLPFPVEDVPS